MQVPLLEFTETFRFNRQHITARRKREKFVRTGAIRESFALQPLCCVDDRHFRADDGRPRFISNRTSYRSGAGLRPRANRRIHKNYKAHQKTALN